MDKIRDQPEALESQLLDRLFEEAETRSSTEQALMVSDALLFAATWFVTSDIVEHYAPIAEQAMKNVLKALNGRTLNGETLAS